MVAPCPPLETVGLADLFLGRPRSRRYPKFNIRRDIPVEKLLRDLGYVCAMYQDLVLRNLPCKRIQVDEIWSFVYAKQKNVTDKIRQQQGPEVGDIWTWTAIDAETKLVPSWLVGAPLLRPSS